MRNVSAISRDPLLTDCNARLTMVPLKALPDAEFKEFEPRLKFKLRLKYGWFHKKLY